MPLLTRSTNNLSTIVYRMSKAATHTFMPQDYFDALSKTQLKAKIGETAGQMVIRFDIRKLSASAYLSEMMAFTERLSAIRDEKTNEKTDLW